MAAPSLVDWALAERVAIRAAGSGSLEASYLSSSLEPDFAEFTRQAEDLVAEETGLRSLLGPAVGKVTDRSGWITANVASFQRMLLPLTSKLESQVRGPFVPATSKIAAAEVGSLLGFMSKRVLGQYDVLLAEEPGDAVSDGEPAGDVVYYVGPNVLSLEKRFGFPPREFRLWLALHEVTHRAQFTGVPWMRDHFQSLVQQSIGSFEPDPQRLFRAVKEVASARREGRRPLDDGGLVAIFATPEQRQVMAKIGGLMSLLEGHGDVTMSRAGRELVPNAARFSRVLSQRRQQTSPAAKLLQRLIGLEAKLKQYEEGERFIAAVEIVGGRRVLDRAWTGPEFLPSLEEIRTPDSWLARVGVCPVTN